MGASTHDVAVGKEGLRLLVVVLLRYGLGEYTLVVECAEELGGCAVVLTRSGTRVDIERDTKTLEGALDDIVVLIYHILRGYALVACLDGDGHTVLVRATNPDYISATQTQITHINIGGNIYARQVTNMYRTIGVWERRSHQISLIIFHRFYSKNNSYKDTYK